MADLASFQIKHKIVFEEGCNIPLGLVPKQLIDGRVMANSLRCTLKYGKRENRGAYGSITKVERVPSVGRELCVKAPHSAVFCLFPEAILQWHASRTLQAAGIHGAIPHIYDIFQYAGESRFTMDFIRGCSAVEALSAAADPDATWILILAQVALVMGYLEEKIYLDHRDLKADNLWIRPVPVEYALTVGGVAWRIRAPFQVVILDFGFACIGNGRGNAIVSLSDGILPKIDPCPKEGRDLFQLITSMWSIPSIRARASTDVKEAMESLLTFKNTSYVHIMNQTIQTHWIYLAVSDNRFKHPPLHPVTLLLKLSTDWTGVGLYRE